ncbi:MULTISPECIES: response regulator [Bacteroides]|jgi:DNA-binding NarL/FixJ family response regulator|uniref:response regulator n=1 Tax=Bacteroides TaxID=816 RepID=UPI000C78A6B5|nr:MULTISPECIES: response regulator transcription factor [Bacteroides]RGM48004.1 DNA-binding response regulator [Bacteroides sp. OM08-11]
MEKNAKAKMLVVDDHSLILDGICRIVNKIPEVLIADAVTSGKQAIELISQRDYDIYLLDVSIPDVSGFDLITQIREVNEQARIIINTMHEEIWIINRLIRSGVNAVILKTSASSELLNAIHCVLKGETYTCPRFESICQKLRYSLMHSQPKDVPTKRELDVLQAVAKGFSTHEIAALLAISENTVETFRKRLISKFGARNAIDMVIKAVERGWLILR